MNSSMTGCFLTAMEKKHKDNNIKICLLGPSFGTGNLGVDALVEASIKVIVNRWPDAEVTLLGSGWSDAEYCLRLFGRDVYVKSMPIRFCKNVFRSDHFMVLFFYAMSMKVFRGRRMREFFASRNPYLRAIAEADMVADITGGDSFSDIYGMRRFITGFLRKWLIRVFRKKLVLLPQTYGPFDKRLTRVLARHIINYATLVYSRDRKGLDDVEALLGDGKGAGKVKFVPDVGFLLDPRRPQSEEVEWLEKIKGPGTTLVGLNISGLLSCSSDGGDNIFNLKIDYPALIDSIVEYLMKQEGTTILLVPHVVSVRKSNAPGPKRVNKKGYREQSDSVACAELYERVTGKHPGRIFLVRGCYDRNETKYIIGLCDFFIGSRMHSCIAALSQGIPAVGVAYSGKFHGVFESVGCADCVADARRGGREELLEKISWAYSKMDDIREKLHETVPTEQSKVLDMFKTIEL